MRLFQLSEMILPAPKSRKILSKFILNSKIACMIDECMIDVWMLVCWWLLKTDKIVLENKLQLKSFNIEFLEETVILKIFVKCMLRKENIMMSCVMLSVKCKFYRSKQQCWKWSLERTYTGSEIHFALYRLNINITFIIISTIYIKVKSSQCINESVFKSAWAILF